MLPPSSQKAACRIVGPWPEQITIELQGVLTLAASCRLCVSHTPACDGCTDAYCEALSVSESHCVDLILCCFWCSVYPEAE